MEGVRRFDDRAETYAKHRPGYPPGVVALLGLAPRSRVADVGSGTGLLGAAFVAAGHDVIGVEPNDAMRALSQVPAIRGSSEATGLDDASVDAAVAGQAFHWFEPQATRAEFLRILKPGAPVLLAWNTWRSRTTPFWRRYEELLTEHCPAYEKVQASTLDEDAVRRFLGPGLTETTLDNAQRLDWNGMRGRALSASYVPTEGPAHAAFFAGLREAFEAHAVEGVLDLPYDVRVFYGGLGEAG